MADFTPTPSQRAAIDTRGSALLVSAAAGSGKTRVLTERLMSYLTDPDDPKDIDSFLVITFTKAAAAELRSRIMDGVGEALAAHPENRRLRRQSALCQTAEIGTIHSFCQKILRENCHLIGISPDFRVADEDRASAMREAALERVQDARYEDMDAHPGFALLADTVGAGRDDNRLAALVLNMHGKMQSHARPEKWAREQVAVLEMSGVTDAGDTVWGREIISGAEEAVKYWASEADDLVFAMASGDEKIRAAYSPAIEDGAAKIRDFCRALEGGWDRAGKFAHFDFMRLGALRNSPDPALSELVKNRWDACKKAVRSIAEQFSQSSESLLADMTSTAPAMKALLALTLDFDAAYSADKRRGALVDFADLEHLAARLLTNEDGTPSLLAVETSARYTEIMVDEYQDVSRVQDAIFSAVSKNGRNLFMVGDVKQAIYRFRLADPSIFLEKYNSYADADKARDGQPRRILLRENFRSRREIINGANAVFSACMSEALGEIKYDSAAALVCGADYPAAVPVPELILIDSQSDSDEEAPDKVRTEADAVAEMIEKLVSSGQTVFDHGASRPMDYGDVAILLRSANAVGGQYRRALNLRGIPSQSGQGGEFFTSIEVSCVMSLLAIIDNPHQDVPLIAALRSPAFGFSPDELSEIRAYDKDADYCTALKKSAQEKEKPAEFLKTLNGFRAVAPDMELGEFVWHLYNSLDLMAVCSAMTDGETRRQNLMLLLEYAKKFEATGYRGLHRFVGWLSRLADRGESPPAGAQAKSVQIMSIHRSKGLEFPVVFLCDTARKFNKQDARETVLIHPVLGLGPKVTDTQRHIEYPTLARRAIKQRGERETLSEEMRLLYVAVTRAKERLFITAAVKEPEEQIEKLSVTVQSPMPPEILAKQQAMYQWIASAVLGGGGGALKMSVLHPNETGDAPAQEAAIELETAADNAVLSELEARLAFAYPHAAAVDMPSKITATELKSRLTESDGEAAVMLPKSHREFRLPDFEKPQKPLTGAGRGTATHLALQYMGLQKAASGGAEDEKTRLLAEGLLSQAECDAVDENAIAGFLRSDTGRRMLAAKKLNREFRFSVLLPAGDFFPDGGEEETLLQGAVDCWFEEPDGIVIVDYKTDNVTEKTVHERSKAYEGQLKAYSIALSAITGKPVKDAVLYFLKAQKAILAEKISGKP